jgi:ABC-type lipoprotein release transport system permease subunit
VSATDPLIFGAITGALMVVSLAAMAVPARRATRVNALEVLRHE